MPAGSVTQTIYVGPSTTISSLQWDDGSGNRTGQVILSDGLGNALLGQHLAASSLPVVLTAAQLSTLTPPTTVAVTGTFWQATQPVSFSSLPLPSGAATESTLSTLNGKVPSLGQALAAASVPVVMTAAQISTLTPPAAITGFALEAGHLASIDTSTARIPAQGQALAAGSMPVVLTAAQISALTPLSSVAVTGTFWQDTQPISASSLPLPSGAATAAKQPSLGTAGTASSNVITVQGIASMTALKVDGSAVTQPISVSSLPLPTDASTSSLQTTGNTYLSNIDGKTPSLGQALAAASVPVVLTSAQLSTLTPLSSIAVTNVGTFAVQSTLSAETTKVIGTVNQGTSPWVVSLTSTTITGSVAVTGTFWQATQPVSVSSLPLPSGAATESTLSTLNGKIPSLGQALAAASIPVVLTAAQLTSLTAPVLAAGSAIAGKFGIDQTTPGTTNAVYSTNFPTTLDTNSGSKSASTIRVVIATDQPQLTNKLLVTPDANSAINLAQVGGSTFAMGQQLAASSIPVVLTASQLTSLTAPVLAAGTAVIGKVSIDQTTPGTTNLVDTELPAAAALSDTLSNPTTPQVGADLLCWDGSQWVRVRVPSTFKDLSTVAIGSITTVWTPASGKKFRLMGGSVSVSAASSILFEDNASGTTIFRTPKLGADSPYNFDIPGGKLSASANNVLKATSSASANIIGTIWGTEE